MRRLVLLLSILAVFSPLAHAQCDLNATTSNFSAQLSVAQPGQRLCLATGNYGSFNGVQKSSPGVTIAAADGATPTISVSFAQTSPVAAWLIFDGITISSGLITAPAHDITFKNATSSGKFTFWGKANSNGCSSCPAMNNQNILFDNVLFNMASNPSGQDGGYEGRFQLNDGGPTPAGIIVRNSRFTTGCADGIQVSGLGYGVTIGPGNEFFNLKQGNCVAHVDPIQFLGTNGAGPVINGNYFHDNSDGIVGWDYGNSGTITNNVITTTDQTSQMIDAALETGVIEHNVIVGGEIHCGRTHQGNVCRATVRNNIASIISASNGDGAGAPVLMDYNLCTSGGSCSGSHSLTGAATYVGGTNPNSYAGYALTSTSRGHAAASDGTDIGMNVTTTTSGPAPPTNLQVIVN